MAQVGKPGMDMKLQKPQLVGLLLRWLVVLSEVYDRLPFRTTNG
jgi:hypothetical protein